jgi:hypothetical protein
MNKEEYLKLKIQETRNLIKDFVIELENLLAEYKIEAKKNINWEELKEKVYVTEY